MKNKLHYKQTYLKRIEKVSHSLISTLKANVYIFIWFKPWKILF